MGAGQRMIAPWPELDLPRPPSVNRFMRKLGNKTPCVKALVGEADYYLWAARQARWLEPVSGPFEIELEFRRPDKTRMGDLDNAIKPLLAQELVIAFACPLLIFDCPYDRLDSRPKLDEICSRHFPRPIDPQRFAQAGDRTFEVSTPLVTCRRFALATLVQEILQHCHVLRLLSRKVSVGVSLAARKRADLSAARRDVNVKRATVKCE